GDFHTFGAEVDATFSADDDRNHVAVNAAAFSTHGVGLVRDPGPVDRAADLDYQRAQVSWLHAFKTGIDLTLTARLYEEERGNGTPLQRNASEERFISAKFSAAPRPDFFWEATLYFQD